MHHPGPPRFVGTGDSVELAPRDPDPTAPYSWSLTSTPADSTATLGSDPVEHLVPDAPGTYVARLEAPDGVHHLTVRAFPGELTGGLAGGQSGESGYSGRSGRSGQSGRSGMSGLSGISGSGSARELVSDRAGAGGRPRLRLEPVVDGDEAIVRAIATPHPESAETADDLSVEFLLDDRDDFDREAVTIDDHELRIPLEALPDPARIHAVAVGEDGISVPDAAEFYVADGQVHAARPYEPPAWGEDSFIYEIYVRAFGGDDESSPFDAIVNKLDYLDELGVDAIWLTPVLQNDHAPHGYNITNFFEIADDLGTREDYEALVDAAHDHDIKVLFDVVCNHSARTHPFFEEALENPDGEYRDWYDWRTETEPETYFEWEHIANFNFAHLPVRRHLLDAFDQWLEVVDGFRCDMAWAVPNGFWKELHDRCKAHDSDFLLLDETIPYIPDFQAGLFDVHFDSTTYFTLHQIGNGQDADTLLEAIEERTDVGFPDHAGFMVYSENHDETRYITECGKDAAEAAMGAVFTLPGAPMIYAGQEFGQRGRRDDLAWEHAHDDLQAHVGQLADVRAETPPLQAEADLYELEYEVTQGHEDRVVTYGRVREGDAVVVVLNFGSEPATVTVPATDGTDLVTGAVVGGAEGPATVESVVVLPADAASLEN